jgi:site-specific DNA-cytosine methylase
MPEFPIYGDLCALDGTEFKGQFDVLCGGFPCQAFSTAAHGKNIKEKNLWGEMLRFVQESEAPVVFAENVVLRAIEKAKEDLENVGYRVARCRLSCSDLGADHQRNRFWLLAVKDETVLDRISAHVNSLPVLKGEFWASNISEMGGDTSNGHKERRKQLLGVGNAQSPFVVASAFRILVNRLQNNQTELSEIVSKEEIEKVFQIKPTWIQTEFDNIGLVHTPTTMANYACPSMMKHQGCRNFTKVFGRPEPNNAEYLMGFPLGASALTELTKENFDKWLNISRNE